VVQCSPRFKLAGADKASLKEELMLPIEVYLEIFSYLSPPDLGRLLRVCKVRTASQIGRRSLCNGARARTHTHIFLSSVMVRHCARRQVVEEALPRQVAQEQQQQQQQQGGQRSHRGLVRLLEDTTQVRPPPPHPPGWGSQGRHRSSVLLVDSLSPATSGPGCTSWRCLTAEAMPSS
jgi:transcription initiation factor TFIID subunit TAF12